jgi:hypothetical protein
MKNQQTADIIKFLKDNIEPHQDNAYGLGYRAAAYLEDGTYLPCVIFRNPSTIVNLALKRFKEEQKGKGIFGKSAASYYKIVSHFVTSGNRINDYDIAKVETSKYAFPLAIQGQIRGETTMGWTGFVAKMKDGKYFGFGTRYYMDFFQMPDGYLPEDIVEIINHSYVSKNGEVRSHRETSMTFTDDYKDAIVFRAKPFFICYIDNL